MKKVTLLIALSFLSVLSFAQGKYGFEAGVGYATIKKSYITPAFTGYYLARLSRTFYAGGAVSFQSYSFLDNLNPPSPLVFGDILSIRQSSSFLFFTPKIEMGIGYRKHLFAHFSFGPGVYLGGNQWTHQYQPYWTTPSGTYGADTASLNTTYNVPNILFRISGGLKQRFPTYRFWNIVVSEEFSYLPGKLDKKAPGVKGNYFSVTIGIMHKYPSVAVEED